MSESSNREMRKIPSLLFLYEINSDGTVIRNVKSKRHLKQFRKSHNSSTEYWCIRVCLKGSVREKRVQNLISECWPDRNGGIAHPVELKKDGAVKTFPTMRRAAVFLSEEYPEHNVKSFCDKFHLRRKRIFDYDVRYL